MGIVVAQLPIASVTPGPDRAVGGSQRKTVTIAPGAVPTSGYGSDTCKEAGPTGSDDLSRIQNILTRRSHAEQTPGISAPSHDGVVIFQRYTEALPGGYGYYICEITLPVFPMHLDSWATVGVTSIARIADTQLSIGIATRCPDGAVFFQVKIVAASFANIKRLDVADVNKTEAGLCWMILVQAKVPECSRCSVKRHWQ